MPSTDQSELLEKLNVKCSKCGKATQVFNLAVPVSSKSPQYGFMCEDRHLTPLTMDHIVSLIQSQ